jgi:hypothetical protein
VGDDQIDEDQRIGAGEVLDDVRSPNLVEKRPRHRLTIRDPDGGASLSKKTHMCRNIRTLFNFEPPATDDEVQAAALQFVRKLSGFTKPSQANEAAFSQAVDDIAAVARELLANLVTTAPPHDRDLWIAKARARAAERFAKSG